MPPLALLLACREARDPAGHVTVAPGDTAEIAPGPDQLWTSCEDPPPLVLNELLATNTQGLTDADGNESDWIELALPTTADALDLGGWSLSREGEPEWSFPALTVAGGDTPLVFASGKDRAVAGEELHTSFSLDSAGGELFLHMPDGCVADRAEPPRTYANQSYGRAFATGAWEHFIEPTPGQPNATESRPGFAETPTLAPPGGFYADPIEVIAAAPVGTTLRYTTDGSVPTEASPAFDGLSISDPDQPIPLRVRAFAEGLWPSRLATATYLASTAPLDGGVQMLSLVVDPPDLWSDERGIYAYGPDYEHYYPYFGANFWELWERDLHVEAWAADGSLLLSQDAGIQIAGGYSRAFDQRNFELIARGGYGTDTFGAALFADEQIADFHRLYLRNGGDWCGTQLIDATVQGIFRDAQTSARLPSVDAQAYEPAMVYLNGEFWGVYELKERLDESYIAAHHDEDPDDLDRVKLGWTHDANWELEQGDWMAFDALEELATGNDLSDPDAWADFQRTVDVDNFAMATVAQGWIGNTDWWYNNIRMWRPHDDDGRWRWMVYDFGHGWTDYNYDHLAVSVVTSSPGMRVGNALQSEEFRIALVNAHADMINTTMAGSNARAIVEALADEVRPVMPLQRERWCGGETMSAWESYVDYAALFAERRADVVAAGVARHLAPGGTVSLSLTADPPSAGRFQLRVVTVDSGFEGAYYRDTPVTVTVAPAEGYTFTGWSEGAGGSDPSVTLGMDADTTLIAHFE